MISASSSPTLRATRKLIAQPFACLEHRQTWAASLVQEQKRGYNTDRPASEKPRRQPPESFPTAARLKPLPDRLPRKYQVKAAPSDRDPEGPKRPLEPYVLSKRLTKLASQGKLDEAVDMLQNLPLDASNVATWNTVLLHCMTREQFKLGYKLFTDVRIPLAPKRS